MLKRAALLLFALVVSVPVAGDYTVTPTSGPTSGGTELTFKGNFPGFVYGVIVGGAVAEDVRRVDAQTLVAVTTEHLPGVVPIRIFEVDRFLFTDLKFTYVGEVPATYERILLPIFLPPVRGQFGSEFVTSFTATLRRGSMARFHGLTFECRFICMPELESGLPVSVTPQGPRLDGDSLVRNGNPGRFIYIPKDEVQNVAMNLRVYDRSRSMQNFGTEIPIVRENRFTEGYERLTLLDVPTDPRFRNTLRIYATGPTKVIVQVSGPTISPVDREVDLVAGANVYEPAMATFSAFPTGVGLAEVIIRIPTPTIAPPPPAPRLWAFVAVTNNDTQMITTVTPQP